MAATGTKGSSSINALRGYPDEGSSVGALLITGFSSHYLNQIIYLVGFEYLCANFYFAVTFLFNILVCCFVDV